MAPAIPMSERHYRLLNEELHKRTAQRHHLDRIAILLRATPFEGTQSNGQIKRELAIALNTVKTWRKRWREYYPTLLAYEAGKEGKGVSDSCLLAKMLSTLQDQPRSGAPKTITLEQQQQLVALACQKPTQFGVEFTTWTHQMLAQVAIQQGLVESISSRYVGTILKKKPTATP